MKKLTFIFLIFTTSLFGDYQYDLAICAIFQNEAPYLDEYIRYHRKVGVEHFWFYNNNSTDNYLEILQPWIEQGIVELINFPNLNIPGYWAYITQPAAYRDAIARAKGRTMWLAIIDLDEYLLPMKRDSVAETLLLDYPDANAIYVHWLNFGTGNVDCGPGPILDKLFRCASKEDLYCQIGKSIVKPEVVATCSDPHFMVLQSGNIYWNGSGYPFLDAIHRSDLLRINHYTFRDEWYFWNTKWPRCQKWEQSLDDVRQRNERFSICENYDIFRILNLSP